MIRILDPIFQSIGAFVFWLLKGFKGRFNDFDTDKSSQKNKWVGILTFGIVIVIYATIKSVSR
jgi:hypothetical protein